MKKEHIHFITGLLSNPRLSSSQKNRVVELSLRDLSKNIAEEKILYDLRLIKEKIGLENSENSKGEVSEYSYTRVLSDSERARWENINEENVDQGTKWNVPEMNDEGFKDVLKLLENKLKTTRKSSPTPNNIIANPKHVADFMSLFNQKEGLKYLTHDYDESNDFEIDKFLESANRIFIEKTKILKIPQSLWQIVNQFAFDSKQTKWSSISENYKNPKPISIGWASKELRDWSKKNGLHPFRHKDFRNTIDDFKRITRIEYSNLEKLIDGILEGVFKEDIKKFAIQKTDLKKADFYSHVAFLKTALETIFEEVKKRSDSPNKKKVSIKYERSSLDGYYLRKIVITHHNSFPAKELKLILKEWHEKGNMGKIKEKLKGYCHWSVETLIEGTPGRVNILRERDTEEYEKIEQDPEGFRHILTFYYK